MEIEEQPDSDLDSISSLVEGDKRIEEMISERLDSTGKLPTSPASTCHTPRNTHTCLSTTLALAGRTTPSAFSPRQRTRINDSRARHQPPILRDGTRQSGTGDASSLHFRQEKPRPRFRGGFCGRIEMTTLRKTHREQHQGVPGLKN